MWKACDHFDFLFLSLIFFFPYPTTHTMEVALASRSLGSQAPRPEPELNKQVPGDMGRRTWREPGRVPGHLESVLSMKFLDMSLVYPGPSLQAPASVFREEGKRLRPSGLGGDSEVPLRGAWYEGCPEA